MLKLRKKKRLRFTVNARLSKLDPTRTLAMRRAFAARLRRKFAILKGKIIKLVLVEDAFGLRPRQPLSHFIGNTRWQFVDDEAKLTAFKRWVKTQIDIDLRSQPEEELWRRYSAEGYKKGQMRVYDEVNKARKAAAGGDEVKSAAYDLAAKDAVRKATEGPAATEAVRRLAARSFNEMDDVTTRMATKMTRALADGLVQQKSPKQIAQDLVDETDIEMNRAMLIARTEISRAVNEGILDAAESEGVTQVGVAVEWMVGDNPCPECEPLEGVVLSIDEARGMLPRHPGCMCAYEVVTERDDDMTTGRRAVERAIGRSQRAGNDAEDWGPAQDIARDRPLSNEATAVELLNRFLANAFCPTGPGGGVDPTCSPGGSGDREEDGREFRSIGTVQTAHGLVHVHYDKDKTSQEIADKANEWLKQMPQKELDKADVRRIEVFENPEDMYQRLEEKGIDPGIEPSGQVRGAYHAGTKTVYASTWDGWEHSPRTLLHEIGHSILGMDEDAAESWAQSHMRGIKANAFCPTGEGGGIDPTCSPSGSGWTKEFAQGEMESLSAESGIRFKMIGSVATKGTSKHDLDVLRVGKHKFSGDPHPAIAAALEKMGYSYEGQQVHSGRDFETEGKQFDKGFSEMHTFKHPSGRKIEVWTVLKD